MESSLPCSFTTLNGLLNRVSYPHQWKYLVLRSSRPIPSTVVVGTEEEEKQEEDGGAER